MQTRKWRKLTLNKPDGHPEVMRLCVIRRKEKGLGGSGRVQYIVGYFFRDERDPGSRKLWWMGSTSHIAAQDPTRWKRFYTEMEWMDIDEEVKRNEQLDDFGSCSDCSGRSDARGCR